MPHFQQQLFSVSNAYHKIRHLIFSNCSIVLFVQSQSELNFCLEKLTCTVNLPTSPQSSPIMFSSQAFFFLMCKELLNPSSLNNGFIVTVILHQIRTLSTQSSNMQKELEAQSHCARLKIAHITLATEWRVFCPGSSPNERKL